MKRFYRPGGYVGINICHTDQSVMALALVAILLLFTPFTTFSIVPHAKSNPFTDIFYTGDTLDFSGHKWMIKDSNNKLTGPGKNYFSSSKENVWVDSLGKLHLKLNEVNEKWYASEVKHTLNLSYGRYTFYIDPLPQPLDKDVVIGLFVYDHNDTSNFHKEVDIEFSKWGKEKNLNSQYVIQPYENQPYRFQVELNYATKHTIEIRKRKITFHSEYTGDEYPDSVKKHIKTWKYKPENAYRTGDEKVSMNLWLYKTTEPASLKSVEVIISRFEFSPFWLEKHKPVIPKFKLFNKSRK